MSSPKQLLALNGPRFVQIPTIKDYTVSEVFLQDSEIRTLKFLPFCDDHQRIVNSL